MTTDKTSRWLPRRAAIAGVAWLAYAFAYGPLHRVLDTHTGITAFVPVVVTAWCCGATAGAVAGLVAIPFTVLLSMVVTNSEAQAWVNPPALLGAVAMVFVGYAVGRTRDLQVTATKEATKLRCSEQALRERDEHLALVNEVARSMKTDAPVKTIVRTAVQSIHQRFPESLASYLNVASEGQVTVACAAGPGETFTSTEKPPPTLSEGGVEPLRERDVIVVNDVETDMSSGGLAAEESRAFVNAPRPHPDGSVGVLTLESSTPHQWTGHELQSLRDSADFLAMAITDAERKQQLIESEQKFRSLANESDINISLMQGDRIIYANPAMERMTGYTGRAARARLLGARPPRLQGDRQRAGDTSVSGRTSLGATRD